MNARARLRRLLYCAVVIGSYCGLAETAAAQTYRFGTDDTFVVRGADIEEIADKPFKVDPSGSVTMPMVGSIRVAGLTVSELEAQINGRLKKYLKDPAVSVSVGEVKSHPVSVFGSVNTSGVYQANGAKTVVEVLSLAGGLRNDAGNMLTVTRPIANGQLPIEGATMDPSKAFWVANINVEKLLSGERPQDNIAILPNDVVSVQKASLVYVIGDVNKAGAIPLVSKLTVTQALARSEGLQKTASRKNVRILRQVPGSTERSEIKVDFGKVLAGRAQDQELQADDIVVIPNNVTRSAALRTVETALQIGTGLIIWPR